jgi:hypothetical protein
VSVPEVGKLPVLIIGRPSDVSVTIATALRREGVTARHSRMSRSPVGVHAVDSMIVVLDQAVADTLFNDRHTWTTRKRLRAWENDSCELAVATALTLGARRLLTVCDARQLSFGQRVRAVRRVQRMAQRVAYECSINGMGRLTTTYAVVDTDDDLSRVADAAMTWHEGVVPSRVGAKAKRAA